MVERLPAAPAPDAHPPAGHGDACATAAREPAEPRARRRGGRADDRALALDRVGGIGVRVERLGEVDAVLCVHRAEFRDRPVDRDGPDGRVEHAEDALRLAQRVGEQDGGPPGLLVGEPPGVDLIGDIGSVGPAVDGEGERGLADEHIALDGLELLGRRVGVGLVIAGDHPGGPVGAGSGRLSRSLDAGLGGAEDVPRWVEGDGGAALRQRLAEGEWLGIDARPDADAEQVARRGAGEVVIAAGAGVVGVGVGDDGSLDGAPGVDVEPARLAPETAVGGDEQVAGVIGHAGLFGRQRIESIKGDRPFLPPGSLPSLDRSSWRYKHRSLPRRPERGRRRVRCAR